VQNETLFDASRKVENCGSDRNSFRIRRLEKNLFFLKIGTKFAPLINIRELNLGDCTAVQANLCIMFYLTSQLSASLPETSDFRTPFTAHLLSVWERDVQRHAPSRNVSTAVEQKDCHSTPDHVRIYLRQMGASPCLTKPEERSGATAICKNRRRYYDRFFASDYILGECLKVIRSALAGKRRLDRYIDFSLFETTKRKEDILRICHCHCETLQKIWEQNRAEFAQVLLPDTTVAEKKSIWQRIQRRRQRAARLLQELHFRMPKVAPHVRKLRRIVLKMNVLKLQIREARCSLPELPLEQAEITKKDLERSCQKLNALMQSVAETPATVRNYLRRVKESHRKYVDLKNWFGT